jgi:hypothetical protein
MIAILFASIAASFVMQALLRVTGNRSGAGVVKTNEQH